MLLLLVVTCQNMHSASHQVACSSGESFDNEPKHVDVGLTRNSRTPWVVSSEQCLTQNEMHPN